MLVNEPVFLPYIKPSADAAGVHAVRCLDSLFVVLMLDLPRVVDIPAMVDKMNPIGHRKTALTKLSAY